MSMRSFVLLLASLCVAGLHAYAQASLEPRTEGGVTFVSGGIGQEGLDAVNAVKSGYNLRLLFAIQGTGTYLADVKVKLLDQKGNTLLDTDSEGPYFLAKVSPGRYKVIVENKGRAITKSAEVSAKGAVSLSFYWPPAP